MAVKNSGNSLLHLRLLFNEGAIGALSDGQLLEQFATGRSEPRELAFATLVERHGPFVLRVCRSVLRDEGAAEDAYYRRSPANHVPEQGQTRDVRAQPELAVRYEPNH